MDSQSGDATNRYRQTVLLIHSSENKAEAERSKDGEYYFRSGPTLDI